VDYWFGELMKALTDTGYLEDSLIVLTADHGHPLADHGKFLKGQGRLYSELVKILFMVRLPGGEYGGKRTKAICQFHDVLPTVLEVLGLGANNDAFQGRSFVPVLKGDGKAHREAATMGYYSRGGRPTDRCIRDGRWSLIERMDDKPDELYDLDADPKETKNLIDEHPDEAKRLASMFGNIFRSAPHRTIKGLQAQYELQAAAE
jgi:arylsulfatase A-like enzyme